MCHCRLSLETARVSLSIVARDREGVIVDCRSRQRVCHCRLSLETERVSLSIVVRDKRVTRGVRGGLRCVLVTLKGSSKRSACHSPPRPHRDSGRSSNHFPPKSRPSYRAHGARYARHQAGRCTTPEGLEAAVAKVDDAQRKVATSFFFGVFV